MNNNPNVDENHKSKQKIYWIWSICMIDVLPHDFNDLWSL